MTEPTPNEAIARIVDHIDRRVLGQREAAEQLVIAYLAGGHALLEGVPGIGKTRLARSFAEALGLGLARVQFTPDLMPADITGSNVFDPGKREFELLRGPVFADLLLADEINRTPPKTQSALLEAMQERQVSIDGTTYPLQESFFVIATQNPIDFEGTYALPEAQADRFLLSIGMQRPDREEEMELYRMALREDLQHFESAEQVVTAEEARALRKASRGVHCSEEILNYLHQMAVALRNDTAVELGVSPRGALALLEASRAAPLLDERDFVIPDDLQRLAVPCWAHRILLTAEAELEGVTPSQAVEAAVRSVEVPRNPASA
ncbi:MAG: MoxR family ATPase [Acidobacteriota bacterium]